MMLTAEEQLQLAKDHLERVQAAWPTPTDWTDLSLYGFYCLENAVCSAATHAQIPFSRSHRGKVAAAELLARDYGLPDVEDLLLDLNDARKAAAYGDIVPPELDAEKVAGDIEKYVQRVEAFIASRTTLE
jgi:hypothetical protein